MGSAYNMTIMEAAAQTAEEVLLHAQYRQALQSSAGLLYAADPDCAHVIVEGDNYSGVKCSKCPGWHCA